MIQSGALPSIMTTTIMESRVSIKDPVLPFHPASISSSVYSMQLGLMVPGTVSTTLPMEFDGIYAQNASAP
jgi:hypothetical protein